MMCPLRASGSYCADCYSTCMFYRSSTDKTKCCLIAQALEVYITENTKHLEDNKSKNKDWEGVKMWIQ